MKHTFKSNVRQCSCLWCGEPRIRYDTPHVKECPVNADIRRRVADFAQTVGKTWRSQLRRHWNSGQDMGLLRQARNTIGPNNLDRITPQMLEEAMKPTPVTQADTPLMAQYRAAKGAHPGMLLLFRMGDFYELFGEDAETACKILGLTITKRGDVPMAGFPYHQLELYLYKLLKEGQRVAVCDQVQDAANAPVRREVTRVEVPGESS